MSGENAIPGEGVVVGGDRRTGDFLAQRLAALSPVDAVLDRPDCTVADLLDLDDLLDEWRSQQNTRLMDFLTSPESLDNLVGYLVTECPPDSDPKLAYKYPYLCCEILCTDAPALNSAIMRQDTALGNLISVLEGTPKSPHLANYGTRVLQSLIERCSTQIVLAFKSRPGIIQRLANNLTVPGVIEFLQKLLLVESKDPAMAGTTQWICDQNIIGELINELDFSKFNCDVNECASQMLCDILSAPMVVSSVVLDSIQSDSCSKSLFHCLFTPISPQNEKQLVYALQPVVSILEKTCKLEYDSSTTINQLPCIHKMIVTNVAKIDSLLLTPPPSQITSGIGEPTFILGNLRLQLVELVVALVKSNFKSILDFLITQNILLTITSMFFQFEWNSLLHQSMQELMFYVFDSPHEEIKLYMVTTANWPNRILAAHNRNCTFIKQTNVSYDYVACMSCIAHLICKFVSLHPDKNIVSQVSGLPGWNDFMTSCVDPTIKNDTELLGGKRPTLAPESIEDGVQQVLEDYSIVFPEEIDDNYDPNFQGNLNFDPSAEFDSRKIFTTDEKPFKFDSGLYSCIDPASITYDDEEDPSNINTESAEESCDATDSTATNTPSLSRSEAVDADGGEEKKPPSDSEDLPHSHSQ
ncbi:Serine/threonine-protein phosphatase 6 regulatory subunit 3 [Pelomyxa schiedti]|nr:Serine/threonine-protein phosphatase 6 regulatory subunit 3 [Pelomyxa schiedti]